MISGASHKRGLCAGGGTSWDWIKRPDGRTRPIDPETRSPAGVSISPYQQCVALMPDTHNPVLIRGINEGSGWCLSVLRGIEIDNGGAVGSTARGTVRARA